MTSTSHDRRIIASHMLRAQLVENMLNARLTAADINEGVKLTHEEYLTLYYLARRGIIASQNLEASDAQG